MYKKVISLSVVMLVLVMIASGCSNSLKDENAKLTKEISDMKEKTSKLQDSIVELTEQAKNSNTKVKDLEASNAIISEQISKQKNSIYPIYSANINSYAKEIHFGTYISDNLSLKNKLDALAKALSVVQFNNLPIEVSEISEIDGKKIAVINLKESEENQKIRDVLKFKGYSWATGYFQGSTGGTMTSVSLIETFLQKDYEGQWIDGVKFLYNNLVIDTFQHIESLNKISYRK
jgi:predicted nuclease with TOPRIM domain